VLKPWLAALAAVIGAAPAHPVKPLQTAIYLQPSEIPSSDAAANRLFKQIKSTGATAVRLLISWKQIAPNPKPAGFDQSDPADPAYRWSATDRVIKLAVANGVQPLVTVAIAPPWAEDGSSGKGNMRVSPTAFGKFATAITARYDGSFQGLPRVKTWLVWNEPNLSRYLAPQVSNRQLVGATRYRNLVNAFATSAHSIHRDNLVVAGLVAPFTFQNDPGPLKFMRSVLCMSGIRAPRPSCSARIEFDAWAVHPYTSGGPRHHAFSADDLSLGDLGEAKRLLHAAVKAKHIVSSKKIQFWVTEFSWDSKPPDRKGVPLKLESQWVSEGLYRMWQVGIRMCTWFLLKDEAPPSPYQSGLYFRGSGWKAKPALTAFRFPFVAFRKPKSVFVWGRAPGGKATVIVERAAGHGWQRIAAIKTDSAGIFSRTLGLRLPRSASVRARTSTARTIDFPLKPPPDRFVNPFGS
jgi:hypothetical protein